MAVSMQMDEFLFHNDAIISDMLRGRLSKKKYILGIDEAGRGPLAGPICLGFVLMKSDFYTKYKRSKASVPKGKDSKKMSFLEREKWFESIIEMKKRGECQHFFIMKSAGFIDKYGISFSIRKSIAEVLEKNKINKNNTLILLDGALRAPKEYEQKTIIKGDEKEKIISLASVVAKVSRDRLMINFAKKYPKYGFEKHKGYGTREHIKMIGKYGPTPLHRKTFCHLESRSRKMA